MAGQDRYLDAMATGVAEATISRARTIKLTGAALLGSALSLFVAAGKPRLLTSPRVGAPAHGKVVPTASVLTGGRMLRAELASYAGAVRERALRPALFAG